MALWPINNIFEKWERRTACPLSTKSGGQENERLSWTRGGGHRKTIGAPSHKLNTCLHAKSKSWHIKPEIAHFFVLCRMAPASAWLSVTPSWCKCHSEIWQSRQISFRMRLLILALPNLAKLCLRAIYMESKRDKNKISTDTCSKHTGVSKNVRNITWR